VRASYGHDLPPAALFERAIGVRASYGHDLPLAALVEVEAPLSK